METQIFLTWYLLFFAFGLVGFAFTAKYFVNWPDKGYGFAKFLGLFGAAMPIWGLASLHILPFSPFVMWPLFLALCVAALTYIIFFLKPKFTAKTIILICIQEIFFLTILTIWISIRAYNSQIEGTEKMMNLAFMNSIDRSQFFPPLDPWLAGPTNTINYYYLGHYLFVYAGKLVNIATNYTYNLALVTIIAQSFISLNSIFLKILKGKHVSLIILFMLLGSAWVCFGGNMHYPTMWLSSVFTQTKFDYFFPNATRIISNTINEFPGYSIVLGDVHGHYLGLPFLIISVGLALVSYEIKINSRSKFIYLAIISPLIMALYGINSWDLLTVGFMFFCVHLVQVINLKKTNLLEQFFLFTASELVLTLPGLILMLPYYLNFHPAIGINNPSVPLNLPFWFVPLTTKSEIIPWLQMWGMFIVISLIYFIYSSVGYLGKATDKRKFVYLIFFVALFLIFLVEFVYLRDIFEMSNPPYFRTNTVFKFYYHAWVLWGIASTYFAYNLVNNLFEKRSLAVLGVFQLIIILYAASLGYIYKAVTDFYPIKNPSIISLDGNAYIEKYHSGDYQAIQWIKENIHGQPVIAEAVGDAYTYFARISANTGLITPIGWPTHEWQWRGDSNEPFKRKTDIQTVYTTSSVTEFESILKKYNIAYVYVGEKERSAYPEMNESTIRSVCNKVFDQSNTRIYKCV